MTNIQLYQQVKDTIGTTITTAEVIEIIAGRVGASANIEQRISQIRKYKEAIAALEKNLANDPDEIKGTWKQWLKERTEYYEQLKQGLPAVTWSGTFKKRSAKALVQYSGLICLDIDKLPTLNALKELLAQLQADPHTFICFISPSGNGIKVIFKVACTADQHKDYFLSIEKYFLETYKVQIDPSGKDVSRLCFLTIDTNIYTNNDAAVYTVAATVEITEPEKKKLSALPTNEKKALQQSGQAVNDVYESTAMVRDYREPTGPGDVRAGRNNFVFKFACNCNRVGISEFDCRDFAFSFASDMKAHQIESTVKSAYNHNAHEHGKYKKTTKQPGAVNRSGNNNNNANRAVSVQQGGTNGEVVQPDYIFWKEQKFKRGKGDQAYEVINFKLSRVDFCDFLFAKGFHLLPTGDTEGFQIVHSGGGIIKPQTPQQVKHFSLGWCRGYKLKDVEEMLRTGQTKYFAKNELDSLPYKDVPIKRDNDKETFFYFTNCYVVIDDKGNIEEKPYTTLESFIWESNKIKFEYKATTLQIVNDKDELLPNKEINCEFARFIAYASYNPLNDEEKHFTAKQITERFLSFCSAIGFMLDGYKHPSKRKAIFAVDHKISERGEAHGRTGKSLIPQACIKLKSVATISGKTYDPKYQFCDEPITIDTQIINFNDMPRGFDVENIFEKIADPYSVNRRNQGFLHFTYQNSPKVYYSTNFTPKGEGESYKARMHIIEFSDYFKGDHTPFDEFGHGFFDDSWSNEEWQRFYSFMLWCVSLYKEGGLIDFPLPNIEARKLVNDVVPEFIDFMEDPDCVAKNVRHKKIEIMEKFNDTVYQKCYNKKLTSHTFTAWLRKFCTTKGYKLNPKQNGKFDKSNSVEYITIADDHYKAEQTTLIP